MEKPSRFRLGSKNKKPDQNASDNHEEAPFLAPLPEKEVDDTNQTGAQALTSESEPAAVTADHTNPQPVEVPAPEHPIHQPTAEEIFHPKPEDQTNEFLARADQAEMTSSEQISPAVEPAPENDKDTNEKPEAEETHASAYTIAPKSTEHSPISEASTVGTSTRPSLKTTHEITSAPHDNDLQDLVVKPAKTGPVFLSAALSLALLIGLGAVWYNMNQGVYSLGIGNFGHQQATNTKATANKSKTLGAETSAPHNLVLNLNLKPLTAGHYQAWITQDNQTTSLGAFNTQAAGPLKNLDGSAFSPTVTLSDPNAILFITVEAGDQPVESPSKSVILSGSLTDGHASLKFIAIDLSKAKGSFTIATPTDPDGQNQKSGIWFAHTDGKRLTGPSLSLPEAPEGWKYEAQAAYKGVTVEIGRFSKPDQTDEFNKFAINEDQVPSFPGEDFMQKAPGFLGIDFPTDLTTGDWQVILSVEPDQNGTDPTGDDIFFIQPFKADIPQGADTYKEYPLTLDLSTLPSGTAELQ